MLPTEGEPRSRDQESKSPMTGTPVAEVQELRAKGRESAGMGLNRDTDDARDPIRHERVAIFTVGA